MSRVLSLAGFQVTLIGRFWVIPEEDFKDPMSGSKEKETIYIHCEGMVLQGSWKAIGSRRTT